MASSPSSGRAQRACELPKEPTQGGAFIRANPTLDGRGIIVGVFDTGVDPGAAGLQTTSDGRRKLIDLVDCTGSGDVDTSHVAQPSADGVLAGLTGRALRLPPSWPPSANGSYHLGIASAYELYPRGLVERVRSERRKRFTEAQRGALAQAQAKLAAAPSPPPVPTAAANANAAAGKGGGAQAIARQRKAHDDLKARVSLLDKAEKAHADVGPLYDVLAFADAEGRWRVCVDTSESGALDACKLLEPFRLSNEFGTLDPESNLNFAVDVFGEGSRVVLCIDAGAHGTHVAGIIGAHFPDRPELNGVAPGCQIIGFKIGDTRLGSMETGAALIRALGAAIERGCSVINLSYGEYANVEDAGRFAAMAERAVHQHGIIFVTSAGNNGPALTTGGAPGTAGAPIAVGAFVTADMMGPQYSLRAKLDDVQYTWSSRGPTADGALNVAISAPGGAIAPVPTWTLQGRQLMNGTSMAAPNATGGVALLLSAMRARGVAWTPTLIRRALEVSAAQAPNATSGEVERWALGRGLLQVQAADEWLRAHASYAPASVRFCVRATVHGAGMASAQPASHFSHSLNAGGRGVYLREPQHACVAEAVADVEIRPQLPHGAPAAAKVKLDLAVRLVPSAPWLSCAPHLALGHGGKSFQLKLRLGGLPAGAHYAEVAGHDAAAPDGAGPLFWVPVTVCKPHADLRAPGAPTSWASERLSFSPGQIERYFLVPPAGATFATLRLRARSAARADGGASPRVFVLHTVQLLPQTAVGQSESNTRASLALPAADDAGAPPAELVKTISLVGGVTLEVAVAQQWNALGNAEASIEVEFGGVRPENETLALDARALFVTQRLLAPFRRTVVEPEGSLTALRRALRPASAKLVPPLAPCAGAPGRGDVWPPAPPAHGGAPAAAPAGAPAAAAAGGMAAVERASYVGYEYVLCYRTKLKEGGDVTVRFPSLKEAGLYESPYEAQLTGLFDAHKKLLKVGDFYASAAKVPAGELEVRLVVRHDSAAFLERLAAMPCVLELKLDKPISLAVAHSRGAALGDADSSGGGGGSAQKLPLRMPVEAGTLCAVHVVVPAQPEGAEAGDLLVGRITYAKAASSETQGSGRRPGGWPVTMVCIAPPLKELPREGAPPPKPAPAAGGDGAGGGGGDDETSDAAFARGALELRLTQLAKLSAHAIKMVKAARTAAAKPARAPPAPAADGSASGAGAPGADAAAGGDSAAAAEAAAAAALARYESMFDSLCTEAGAAAAAAPAAAPGQPQLQPPSLLLRARAQHVAHCDGMAARCDAGALRAVVEASDRAAELIDTTKMAGLLAVAADAEDATLVAEKEAADGHKKVLVTLLRTKALALADLAKLAAAADASAAAADGGALQQLDEAMAALHRWAPPTEHAKLAAAWHGLHGRHALALTALDDALAKEKGAPAKADVEARLAPLRALGWAHLAAALEAELLVNYPRSYPPGFA